MAMPVLLLLSLCVVFLTSISQAQSTADDTNIQTECSSNFFAMEQSLLQNTDNRFNLMTTFFPPRKAHPVIVRVTYSFNGDILEDNSSTTNTTISPYIWFWSESEFYLIQPLEVFQFTSLLFGNRPYRQRDLDIVLDANCSQASDEFYVLLTTRLQLYAQSANTGPTAPTQRVSSGYTAVAISLKTVSDDHVQTTFVKIWLHLTVIAFPILSWLLLYLCDPVQLLLGEKTWAKLEDEHTHGTIAAMIQISVIFTTFVFVLDIFGVYFTVTSDFVAYDSHAAFYLSSITGMLIDVGAFVWVVIVLSWSCQWDCRKFYRWLKERDNQCSKSKRIKKLFSTVTVAPILCLTNHLHYIIIAFMSDPFHAGSTAIVYVLSFFLFFFVFRQFYNRVVLHSNRRPKIVTRMELCPKCAAREKKWSILSNKADSHRETFKSKEEFKMAAEAESGEKCNCFIPGPDCHAPFNTEVVVLGIAVIGPLLMIYEAIILILFTNLPITKSLEDAPSRVYTIYQGTGLIIVALLTYNIVLNPTPFSIGKTIERLAKRLHLPENTNFWNRLSIEEKLAKVLVTLLETHFHNSSKKDDETKRGMEKEQETSKEEVHNTSAASSNNNIQLQAEMGSVRAMAESLSAGEYELLETEI